MHIITTAGGQTLDLDTKIGAYHYIGEELIKHGCTARTLSAFENLFPNAEDTKQVAMTPEAEGEVDPTGRKSSDAGAKLDAGKNRIGLVMFGFARALQEVGKVGTYGSKKYSDNGWMQVPDGESRYTDAMLRHLMKEAVGEEKDTDSGLLHAAQVAWNALARLELMMRNREETKP